MIPSLPKGARDGLGWCGQKRGGEDIRPQSSLPTPQALRCSMDTEGAQPLRSASSIPEFGIVHHVLLVSIGNSHRFPKLCVPTTIFVGSGELTRAVCRVLPLIFLLSSEKDCPSGDKTSV